MEVGSTLRGRSDGLFFIVLNIKYGNIAFVTTRGVQVLNIRTANILSRKSEILHGSLCPKSGCAGFGNRTANVLVWGKQVFVHCIICRGVV